MMTMLTMLAIQYYIRYDDNDTHNVHIYNASHDYRCTLVFTSNYHPHIDVHVYMNMNIYTYVNEYNDDEGFRYPYIYF